MMMFNNFDDDEWWGWGWILIIIDDGDDHGLFSAQRHELQKRHKELLQGCQTKPHNLPIVEVQIEREKEVLNYNDEI